MVFLAVLKTFLLFNFHAMQQAAQQG